MPAWQEPQGKGQHGERHLLQGPREPWETGKQQNTWLRMVLLLPAVGVKSSAPKSPFEQGDCRLRSSLGVLGGRTLLFFFFFATANWLFSSLTKFREHQTSPKSQKKLINNYKSLWPTQLARKEPEPSSYTGRRRRTSQTLHRKWLPPHEASKTKGPVCTRAQMQNDEQSKKHTYSTALPEVNLFFFFFLKQEESWWLERTKKGFKSADIGAGWSWVGPGVGPYSGMAGVFGHPQGQGGYRCLENREASGTAHEDNNHQIPATQLQRCLYTGLLWGPERMAAVCPGCACPDWTGAVLSYSQCVPSTGPISGMQQKLV